MHPTIHVVVVQENIIITVQNVEVLVKLADISDLANPECEECGGEGICHYARGDRGFNEECPKCFPLGVELEYYD